MAYLIGLATEDEIKELERRGWEFQDFGDDAIEELSQTHERTNGTSDRMVMVFVDSDLAKIMTGPDWEGA